MERKTVEQKPDGTVITTVEKSGFVVRDAVFGIIGGACGIVMGGVAVPVIQGILPEAVKASKPLAMAATGIGSAVAGELTEHSIVRALSDVAEFTDGIHEEAVRKMTEQLVKEGEKVQQTNKK